MNPNADTSNPSMVFSEKQPFNHSILLVGTGIFALAWVIARACVQSITIDEADTFLAYVIHEAPTVWYPEANNHVLNSLLMRLITTIFGFTAFSIRLPALIGAAIYITSAYYLVRLITKRLPLRWALFVCLVFNPFVMDYLVAARGYAMALGFLTSALTLAAWQKAGGIDLHKAAMLISACMALSVSANLSFAVANAVMIVLIIVWIGRDPKDGYLKTLGFFVFPGLAIACFLIGSIVFSWPKDQFTWGANSLLETGRGLLQASLFRPNEFFLNPPLHSLFVAIGQKLYPLLGLCLLWHAVMLYLERSTVQRGILALIGAASLTITLLCHQILYLIWGILLPLDRTALFIPLMFFVMAGAVAAITLRSRMGRTSGIAVTAALVLIAVYSIGCLRLTYFHEWIYDADVKKGYEVLAYYNRTHGLTDASVNWRYVAALNAYREISGSETLHRIENAPNVVAEYPPDYLAYVLFYPEDGVYIEQQGLKVVYHDQFTEMTVAIRPELETQPPCIH